MVPPASLALVRVNTLSIMDLVKNGLAGRAGTAEGPEEKEAQMYKCPKAYMVDVAVPCNTQSCKVDKYTGIRENWRK